MILPYWHVDAFADRAFAGNQAAVMVLDDWLPDATLRAIAAENMFAETAFLVREADGAAQWALRWFTPAMEVRLCGHATLASGHVVLDPANGLGAGDRVVFRTRAAGLLEVRRSAGHYELALPLIPTERRDWAEASALLGSAPREVWRSADRHRICLFADEAEVRGLTPDLGALARLGNDQFICTAPARAGSGHDIVSRVFVPGAGVDEDSVTGSAHAALAPFWAARLGRNPLSAHQASPRGGDLTCRIDYDRVWLGGGCVTVVAGRFYLSG